jgi:hypothetical protein
MKQRGNGERPVVERRAVTPATAPFDRDSALHFTFANKVGSLIVVRHETKKSRVGNVWTSSRLRFVHFA